MKASATHATLWCLLASLTISLSPLAHAAQPNQAIRLTDEDRQILDALSSDVDDQDLTQTWLSDEEATEPTPIAAPLFEEAVVSAHIVNDHETAAEPGPDALSDAIAAIQTQAPDLSPLPLEESIEEPAAAASDLIDASPALEPLPFEEVIEEATVVTTPMTEPEVIDVAPAIESLPFEEAIEEATVVTTPMAEPEVIDVAPAIEPVPFEETIEEATVVTTPMAEPEIIDVAPAIEPVEEVIEDIPAAAVPVAQPDPVVTIQAEETVQVLTPNPSVVPDYDQRNPSNLHPCDVRDEYLTDWQVENCPQPL